MRSRTSVFRSSGTISVVPYARLGRHAEALEAYEMARGLQPVSAASYMNIAAALRGLNRWEDAAVALFQAALIAPQDPAPVGQLADIYRALYPDGHAIVSDPAGGQRINLDDPVVRRASLPRLVWPGEQFSRGRRLREAAASAGSKHGSCAQAKRATRACGRRLFYGPLPARTPEASTLRRAPEDGSGGRVGRCRVPSPTGS